MWPYPDAPKVLEIRPLPLEKLSGRRHVPILTHASGFPFLRFKKPQSPFLSRVLRNKLNQRQNLFETLKRLDEEHNPVAAWEDQWDQHVRQQLGQENRDNWEWMDEETLERPGGWRQEVLRARRDVWERIQLGFRKTQEKAKVMLGIVDKEKELQRKEKWDRRQAKRLEKMRKKEEEARKGLDTPEKGDVD